MDGLPVYVKKGLPFARDLSLENSADSYLCFQMFYFTQCLTSFSSIDHLLCYCARFLILFHLTQIRFSRSTLLLMCLSLETSTPIIRTALPFLGELIDLLNSVIIFLSQMTLPRLLTFLLASQTVGLTVLLFWIYLFLVMLVFALQWLSLHWEIHSMLLSYFPLTFHHIRNGIPRFIALLATILVLIGTVQMII